MRDLKIFVRNKFKLVFHKFEHTMTLVSNQINIYNCLCPNYLELAPISRRLACFLPIRPHPCLLKGSLEHSHRSRFWTPLNSDGFDLSAIIRLDAKVIVGEEFRYAVVLALQQPPIANHETFFLVSQGDRQTREKPAKNFANYFQSF